MWARDYWAGAAATIRDYGRPKTTSLESWSFGKNISVNTSLLLAVVIWGLQKFVQFQHLFSFITLFNLWVHCFCGFFPEFKDLWKESWTWPLQMGWQPARCMHKCYDLVLHGSSHFCPIFFFSSFINSNDVSKKSRWKFSSFEAQSRVTRKDSHFGDFPMSISLEICFIVQFGMFVTLSNCVCMVQVFIARSECHFSLWALKNLQKMSPLFGSKKQGLGNFWGAYVFMTNLFCSFHIAFPRRYAHKFLWTLFKNVQYLFCVCI